MATARTKKRTGTAPGSRVDVRLEVPAADCSIVNAQGSRVVESGAFEQVVGHSSRDQDLLHMAHLGAEAPVGVHHAPGWP